jgi:hypothetical protein
MQSETLLEVSIILTPLLLAIIAFFIKSLHKRFEDLEHEVRQGLIDSATFNQRVIQLEKEVENIRKMILELIKK